MPKPRAVADLFIAGIVLEPPADQRWAGGVVPLPGAR